MNTYNILFEYAGVRAAFSHYSILARHPQFFCVQFYLRNTKFADFFRVTDLRLHNHPLWPIPLLLVCQTRSVKLQRLHSTVIHQQEIGLVYSPRVVSKPQSHNAMK